MSALHPRPVGSGRRAGRWAPLLALGHPGLLRILGLLGLLGLLGASGGCDDGATAEPATDHGPFDHGPRDPGTTDRGPSDLAPPDLAPPDAAPPDLAPPDLGPDAATGIPSHLEVEVTLDGVPAAGVRVSQGGTEQVAFTDADGRIAAFALDRTVVGDVVLVASHPEARQRSQWIFEGYRPPARFGLERYGADDPTYRFADPGEPARRNTTAQCGHCHLRINDAWFESAHRQSARNPVVHDLYAGTASGHATPEACAVAGGAWREARLPGGGRGPRCFVGAGALPTLNAADPDCAAGPCDAPQHTGGCADCHAPALDSDLDADPNGASGGGTLGGRDLLDATDLAFTYGVSCDVCHRVDAVVPEAAPGVAGRLRLTRPRETAPASLGGGGKRPLTFGPSHDSPNPRMGSVQRDHFRDGALCVGCHEYHHGALVPGTALDAARWPERRLPIQTTFSEWQASPYAPAVPCNECHMPADALAANGADLQAFPQAEIGVQGGWVRPAGSVRTHAWYGPREPRAVSPEGERAPSRMLTLAAGLFVETALAEGQLTARVTVQNAGAGHALPTGEPMRHLVLTVEAFCGAEPLRPTGGDAVPDLGGAVAGQPAGADWGRWPGAQVGDVVRVVDRPADAWHDHPAPAPFDAWPPAARGVAVETVRGAATVTAVDPETGAVTLDAPLPPGGDHAWLTRPDPTWPAWAGHPGFAFGKVLVDAEGRRDAHHVQAVDLVRDNRLPPLAAVQTEHRFAAPCAAPTVVATLRYRPYPWALARARGWVAEEQIMAEVRR